MNVLIIAEHNNAHLSPVTHHAVSAAQQLSTYSIDILVAGDDCVSVAEEAATITGINRVIIANSSVYKHQLAEAVTPLILEINTQNTYAYILAPATTTGKDILPRVAALLDVEPLSDIISVETDKTFKRPIYAGNAIATVSVNSAVVIATVRGTAFDAAVCDASNSAPIITVNSHQNNSISECINEELTVADRPELSGARVVISGGRGMQSGENFALIERIADKLDAAIGASRAAVDAGYVSNDLQVGQTGKIVAPELYIAVGISGAIQHLAGMKESKVIVAINKDEEAPIFQIADYGLVGDLFDILPELEQKL
ncbi:electron transfer flavoprotein subunit alpha/FixB family protein [Eionea flava]